MTGFGTSVSIRRPIQEVFAFVSDPLNFPQWNSAVRTVRTIGGRNGEVGSRYTIERELPSGRVANELAIVARKPSTEFGIRTTSGPTPFDYRYRLSAANGHTVVHLEAVVELDGAAALLPSLVMRAIKRGVDDNFDELKRIVEASPRLACHTGWC